MGVVVFEVLAESIESLRGVLAILDPAVLEGADAKRLVDQFVELERLAAAGRTLALPRVAETNAWQVDGAFRDVSAWLASRSGVTVGRAKATVETASRLDELAETSAALRAGALSDVQAEVIAAAASADPAAESSLLECAARNGVKGLKDECARVEAAASTDQAERYARVRANRYLRHRRISDVEGLIEMRGPIDATASVMAALEPYEKDLFHQARKAERREEPEALAFDAAVEMADDAAAARLAASPSRAPATLVMRVDHSAFRRGHTVPGEVCEIAGIGPVPVFVAHKLAADAIFKALIHDGTDVLAVSHLGRTIPARLRTAVLELFSECAIEGCHVNRHLEIDHNTLVSEQGPTALWNLCRLCRFHHDHKHRYNQRVEGEGTNRRLVPATGRPPPGPPAPGPPPRRQSKARARSAQKSGPSPAERDTRQLAIACA
jgi:hypothetical protein